MNKGKIVVISSSPMSTELIPEAYFKADSRTHNSRGNKSFCKQVLGMRDNDLTVILISPLGMLDKTLRDAADIVLDVGGNAYLNRTEL